MECYKSTILKQKRTIITQHKMKKVVMLAGALALFSFAADRFISMRIAEPTVNYHWNNLNSIKAIADQSNLPHSQVKFIISAIDSLQKDMARNARLDSVVAAPTPAAAPAKRK
jgi:hypothetical protein